MIIYKNHKNGKSRIEKISNSFLFLYIKIKNKEVEINRIYLLRIIENYLRLLIKTHSDLVNLEIVSNFLITVSELLLLKSDLLLPSLPDYTEDEIDNDIFIQEEDVRVEQKKYQFLIKLLSEKEFYQKNIYNPYLNYLEETPFIQQKNDFSDLIIALENVLSKNTNQDLSNIENYEINIVEKMEELEELFLKKNKLLTFSQIIPDNYLKIDIIITFLALLQLICLGKVDYKQSKNFDEIFFYKK